MDRLGSVVYRSDEGVLRRYRPYGQEYSAGSPNDQDKFATYYRDNDSQLDYADNRYYQFTMGRFATPDPYPAPGVLADSRSWNLYSYASSDPVNFSDPLGLFTISDDDVLVAGLGGGTILHPYPVPSTGGEPAFLFPYQAVAWAGLPSGWSYDCVTWECAELDVTLPEEVIDSLVSLGLLEQSVPVPVLRGPAGSGRIRIVSGVYTLLVTWWKAVNSKYDQEQRNLDSAFDAALRECKKEGKAVPEDKRGLERARGDLKDAVEDYKLRVAERIMGNADQIPYRKLKELAKEILCGDQ